MKSRKTILTSLLLSSLIALSLVVGGLAIKIRASSTNTSLNLTQFVNPFVGTQTISTSYSSPATGGFTFPGADTPFGMVQFSPDTLSALPGGYSYNDNSITGFSLTHLSGAGCSIYHDIPFMPFTGSITSSPGTNPSTYASSFSHSNEVAHPGYYSVKLGNNVQTELTVTPRTGFGQFTYPASTTSKMLIYTGRSANGSTNASVSIDSAHQVVSGSSTSGHFCSSNNTYTIYFAAQFDVPFGSYGTWNGAAVHANATTSTGAQSGAYVVFDTTRTQQVHARIGVSFVSVANAQANLQTENPQSSSFSTVQSAANTRWNNVLNSIQATGGSAADTTTFYTALYHAMLFPSLFSDANGTYIGFDNKIHSVTSGHAQYANFSGWDIYHSLVPLLAMLVPGTVSDMMQSLVNDYQQSGCLPKWSVANAHTNIEDGDSADPIIAEAYAFGATNFDTATALQAMIKGGTQGCTSGNYVERAGLSQYLGQGFIPYGTPGLNGTSSATLEYASDDFAISQFALRLGDMSSALTFSQHAQNWQNIFNVSAGFIEPRNSNGTYIANFSPSSVIGFHGSDAYQYTWMIPFNYANLFSLMGGNQNVVTRLNSFFQQLNAGPTSANAYMGNEPDSSAPWAYDFAGQPWQTQSTVRRIITQLYNPNPNGIAGNDDLGQLASWYVWGALGMFPEYPGSGDVVLGSPLFPQITIALGNGKQIQITASGAADNAPYVQSLSVNGQSSTQLWQPYSTLANGASFQFALSTTANTAWGTSSTDAPPSFGTTINNNQPGPVSKTWYFAEGRVASNFREFLTLGNPNPLNTCAVTIEYLLQNGSPVTKSYRVNPDSRLTVSVNNDLGNPSTGVSVSTIITVNSNPTCSGIVAERPMYFNYYGVNNGSDVVGAISTSKTFYFADIASGGGYNSFITILNPPGLSTANVKATYYANGVQVGLQSVSVPSGTRGTIAPGAIALPQHTTAIITSDQPVVVERPEYYSHINAGIAGIVNGAASVVGSQSLASEFLFAEGYTGTNSSGGKTQEDFVISNLDVTAATVTIGLEYTDGTKHPFNITVPSHSQVIWDVNTNGTGATSNEVSADITSSGGKIVVERLMFFQYSHIINGTSVRVNATGGTDVTGQVGPPTRTSYSFAEGYSNTGYNEWLTVQNPTANTETLRLTLVNGNGKLFAQTFSVSAHSRYTQDISALVLQNLAQPGIAFPAYEVSMTVTSSNNAVFVTERPMYWNTSGSSFPTQGGSDVIGYAG